MTEDPCPTFVSLGDGRTLHFEEYLIRERSPDDVKSVDLAAAQKAAPGEGVLEAIARARTILICPSNPVVSIGPILAIPGIREAIIASTAPVVGVSPIIGQKPVKGPADRLLRGLGAEVSARGVARFYGDLIDGFVFDEQDAAQHQDIADLGLASTHLNTLMHTDEIARNVAEASLAVAEKCS